MTTYYQLRAQTYAEIDKLLKKGRGTMMEDLCFTINRYKGFPPKFTMKYVNDLIERGAVLQQGDGKLYWRGFGPTEDQEKEKEKEHETAMSFFSDLKEESKKQEEKETTETETMEVQ